MARPRKEGLDYFPLDVNLDYKWDAIFAMHGGVGCWACIQIIQECYKQVSGELNISGVIRRKTIEEKTKLPEELFEKIISTATEVELFDKKLWEEQKIITSNGIKKRIDLVSKTRKSARIRSEKEKNDKNSYSPKNYRITNEKQPKNNRITTEKYRKEKEKDKGKERKEKEKKKNLSVIFPESEHQSEEQEKSAYDRFKEAYPLNGSSLNPVVKQILTSAERVEPSTVEKIIRRATEYDNFCRVMYPDDYPHNQYIMQAENWIKKRQFEIPWSKRIEKASTKTLDQMSKEERYAYYEAKKPQWVREKEEREQKEKTT